MFTMSDNAESRKRKMTVDMFELLPANEDTGTTSMNADDDSAETEANKDTDNDRVANAPSSSIDASQEGPTSTIAPAVRSHVAITERLEVISARLRTLLTTPTPQRRPLAARQRDPIVEVDGLTVNDADAFRELRSLLAAYPTERSDWTHLWGDSSGPVDRPPTSSGSIGRPENDGANQLSRLVRPEDALRLYTLASYDRHGMACLERRISNVVRLALLVALPGTVDTVRLGSCLDVLVHERIVPDLGVDPKDRCIVFVLQTGSDDDTRCFELHCPASHCEAARRDAAPSPVWRCPWNT